MTIISVRLGALRKSDISRLLDRGVANVSWLEGCIDYTGEEKKNTFFFKTRLNFLYCLERNDIPNTILLSDFP